MATYSKVMSGNSAYTVYLEMTQGTQNKTNNTTVVNWKAYVTKSSGSGYYNNTANDTLTITIGGSVKVNTKITHDFRNATPKTIQLGSGTHTVTHGWNGSGSCAGSCLFTDGSGNLGSATASGTLSLTSFDRRGTITSASNPWTVNSGFNVTVAAASNGLTHAVSVYGTDGTTAYRGYTNVTPGTSTLISSNASEQNALYNAMTSSAGMDVRIYCRTMSGTNVVGYTYTTVRVQPKTVNFSIPSTFSLGTAFTVTVTKNFTSAYHTTGIAIGGSWMTGYPVTMSTSETTKSITTSTDAQKYAIMGINTGQNSFTVQIYTRQYNASGKELGLVIKDIAVTVPNISASITTPTIRIKSASVRLDFSGNITKIDGLEYTTNNGSTWTSLSTAPADPYTHSISGLTPGTKYTYKYRWKQAGTNYKYTSGNVEFTTIPMSTLTVSPTNMLVDDTLKITTTKASATTNDLIVRRLTDNVNIRNITNHPAGTYSTVLTDADFLDGASFNGRDTVTVRVYLNMNTAGSYDQQVYKDVIVSPNGMVYVLTNGTWTRHQLHIKDSGAMKKAMPYVKVNGAWVKAKS